MTNIFLAFLEISMSISFLIVLLLLLGPLLNKRYAARWKYRIWIVLAIRLIIPLGWPATVPQLHQEPPASVEAFDTPAEEMVRRQIVLEIPEQITAPIGMQFENIDRPISALDILAFVWMLGSLLFMSAHLISYIYCRRQIRKKGRPVKDRGVQCLLLKLKHELHMKSTVYVMEYTEAVSPMVIGFFHTVLVLPEKQCDIGKKGSLFFILKHELIHIKRRDVFFKLLLMMARAVHWFNPLVWIMQKEAEIDMELSCDERVTQGLDYAARKAYTEMLLSSLYNPKTKRIVLSTEFYGGKQIMKKRFKNILSKAIKKNGIVVLSCAVLLTVTLGTMVGCSVAKENPENESVPVGIEDMEEPFQQSPAETESMDGSEAGTTDESSFQSSVETESQPDNADLLYGDPVYLEDYYNTPEGRAAIEADFEDLVGEGMEISFLAVMDELIVTIKYEDAGLLTEGIEDVLSQQLDALHDHFWEKTIAYDKFITWRSVLTVRYSDSEGNILAERSYSAE